jgi:transcriptional regulator with XRE-family HTH domain
MLQIKKLCKDKGIPLGELADKLEINRVTMSRIVNNSADTTTTVLKKIAKILKVEVKELFTGDSMQGFVKVDGTVYEIESKKDLENLLATINQA